MTDLREAQTKELVAKAPSCTSNYRSLENPELTPLLKTLIEQSASPLRAIETDFAVDSSGFATTVYSLAIYQTLAGLMQQVDSLG